MTHPLGPPRAVVLSAAGHDRLRRSAERLRDHLAGLAEPPDLADIAYTSQVGRTPLRHRLAIRCGTVRELLDGLTAFLAGRDDASVTHGVAGAAPAGPEPGTEVDAAVQWVAGRAVDWRRHWPVPARRVPLPTYPFGSDAPAPELLDYLVRAYAEESGLPGTSVDARVPLTDLGLSSFVISKLNARLERDLGERSRTLFFEHSTLAAVADALAAHGRTAPTAPGEAEPVDVPVPGGGTAAPAPAAHGETVPASARVAAEKAPARADHAAHGEIAVIGIAGRFPRSPGLREFWANLEGGRDCVGPHPADRARPGWPVHLMEGGYLDQVDRFDPLLFGITPRDAALMDPQERQFLEVTWEALEDAGYPRTRLRTRHQSSVAVYAGAMWNEYPFFGVEQTLLGSPQDSGATLGGIANRVSYCFDLRGPSLTVDTMCSSALVALDLAVRCLRRGETELAIAGAVSLSLHPNKFIQQDRMSLTASDHRSHSFGAGGDGFVPSEGVGVVLLKPLERALADGDRVHAVIRGTSVVHAGRTNGYIVPSPAAQADVVRRALHDARTEPAEVGYVEAHGAGTALGDPVEIDGLTRVFGDLPAGSVPIGSVKSVIGHAEAAAGLAGLAKVVLQLRHGVLAPSLHADRLNPDVDWDSVPFRVQRTRAEWTGPRVAGISSFGAGGTIAHAVVAAPPATTPAPAPTGAQVVVLSAYDADRLDEVVRRLAEHLRSDREPGPERLMAALRSIAAGEVAGSAAEHAAALLAGGGPALADIAFTLQVGREHLRQRLAVVVEDVAALRECLESYRTDPRVLLGRAPASVDPSDVLPDTASLADLARHWVGGGFVDWARRHAPGRSIVELPTYPFARVRCRLPERATPETPLYRKVWTPDPTPAPALPHGAVLCVGGDPEAVAALGATAVRDEADLAAVLDRTPEVSGLVDLPGGPSWETRVAVLRGLLARRPRSPLRIVHVTGDDVRTAGFVRAIGAEYARVSATVLDTDRRSAVHHEIRAEWGRRDPFGEVRYRGGVRHRPRLEVVDAPWSAPRCDPAGAYLVTGGTRGTGALVAGHLADHGARAIALVGVRDSDETASALRARGVRVLRHGGGFTGVDRFLDRVRAELGPLRGVVHCAGVATRGAPAFVHKDVADIRAVLEPKLDGFEALVRLCAADRLDFFLVFSSVCAAVPSLAAGVSDYAAANMAVDDLVRGLVRAGRTEFRAVDWPQWSQTGSTSTLPNPCAPAGIGPLDDAAGLRVLDRVLALPVGEVVLPCPPLGAPPDPDALISARPAEPGPAEPVLFEPAPSSVEAVAPVPVVSSGGWLVGLFSAALGIPERDLDPTAEFGDLGVDSVLLGELLVRVEERLGRPLDPATLLLHPTLERLAAHLDLSLDEAPPVPAAPPEPVAAPVVDGRIAVIGVACRFPGADDTASFWDNLVNGRSAVGEVPASRWDVDRWWSPEPALGRSISKWGGFVDGIEWFDPAYFGMDDDEARCLDPAIRLVLEGTAECVAASGRTADELRGKRVAVVVGARLSDYGRRVPVRSDVLRSDQNFIAARVAHQFDFRGPNLVVDSACSSSLVAVQVASRSLLAGESELAVVAGVEVLLDHESYLDLSAARALSPTGRCWTFDQRADGFVPAEGCGVVLLKPLAAALADGDRVHAVIDAVAVNNDGHTMGVTTPNPLAQADVVRQALAAAGRTPAEISVLEAHGTGTLIGDPIELRALNEVFGGVPGPIEIGSVKSNIGHLLSAAGMAGLVKVVLALEHGVVPPTLHCDTPNPRFDFARSPLRPTTRAIDWPAGRERVAGLSSFGLGGTNAHLVASAAPPHTPVRVPLARPVFDRKRLWLDPRPESPGTTAPGLPAPLPDPPAPGPTPPALGTTPPAPDPVPSAPAATPPAPGLTPAAPPAAPLVASPTALPAAPPTAPLVASLMRFDLVTRD
ncbi:SDR family NAD(P)-dependent oxidoreductase [Saccharothrix obliqua]|uniref:SDR family NAD(P)-dependent oxidoreductase n=1 Tax=Saccharothrix obliqua TaxID=2861747 RepID=UPI001C601422|nr:SDR family NAD(P)-dependent oxidoreductase [Saccharothrix obliqua]MBW4720357.1 SDR family NAD(P)-dependent oxidoreductase [Saccharothrix obliqua]